MQKKSEGIKVILDNRNQCLIGYSSKIGDPAFQKYVQDTNRWAALFSVVLALATALGFYIYGETSSEMDNPEAIYIGLGIGGMFLVIAFFQIILRRRGKTWDGIIVDKKMKHKQRKQSTGSSNDDYYWVDYVEYVVVIQDDQGKKYEMITEDDHFKYDYYQVGDQVRYHGFLKSYEKYDKSKDTFIFCNACASINDIKDDVCYRCNCPLLK